MSTTKLLGRSFLIADDSRIKMKQGKRLSLNEAQKVFEENLKAEGKRERERIIYNIEKRNKFERILGCLASSTDIQQASFVLEKKIIQFFLHSNNLIHTKKLK